MRDDYLKIAAPVFNIQTYSIHDGPGIRVTVFVKGCPLRCMWCANPESNLSKPQLMTYAVECIGCGQCMTACPNGAIFLGARDGKAVALTDRSLCTNCEACVSPCSNGAREMVGRTTTVGEALKKILPDKLFMDTSGGGMTLSGGECLMYPEFSEALFFACKQEGVSTAIETSCFAPREVIDRVFEYVDLCLLDVKHMSSEEHKRLTGVANDAILDNIRHIYHRLQKQVVIRVPVVPSCNDSRENISATAMFVRDELGTDVPIHLLPYHRMGESKNDSLGKEMRFSVEPPTHEHMRELASLVGSFGIKAQIGG